MIPILFVNHSYGGGTEKNVNDLANALVKNYEWISVVVATVGTDEVGISVYKRNKVLKKYSFLIFEKNQYLNSSENIKSVLLDIIKLFSIKLIHFHHFVFLKDFSLDLNEISLPYFVTLHDYFFVCPTVNLINTKGRFCSGCIPEEDSSYEFRSCMMQLNKEPEYLSKHRIFFENILSNASKVILPNESMLPILLKIFSNFRNYSVIEHGVDIKEGSTLNRLQRFDKKIKILLIGDLSNHKGFEIIKEICSDNNVLRFCEFELWGKTFHRLPNVKYRGVYDSKTLTNIFEANDYDLSLQLSITAESYSYTISELIANRIPIICFNLGAQAERVTRFNAGWVVSEIDSKQVIRLLLKLAEDRSLIKFKKESIKSEDLISVSEMAKKYMEIYVGFIDRKTTFRNKKLLINEKKQILKKYKDRKRKLFDLNFIFFKKILKRWLVRVYLVWSNR